jgi:hypothetical protein
MIGRKQGQIINITASLPMKPRSEVPAQLVRDLDGSYRPLPAVRERKLAP